MNPELSIFAARLRDFIGFCSADSLAALPAAELRKHFDAEFNALALVLFGLQFRHNAAYRKIAHARGAHPDALTHWTQIPAAPTAAFKECELTSLAPGDRAAVFHSSGTTEQKPSRHFHCADSLATYEASLWSWFAQNVGAGFPPSLRFGAAGGRRVTGKNRVSPGDSRLAIADSQSGTPSAEIIAPVTIFDGQSVADNRPSAIGDWQLVILTPPPALAPHSSLVHMFATIRSRACESADHPFLGHLSPDGAWTLDLDATLRALTTSPDTGRPILVLGTAFSFVHLLDFLAEKNLHLVLPPGSRVMETGGYKNRSRSLPKVELHALITKFLGVSAENIICEYGMSELSSQAYDSGIQPRVFRFPSWARMQIISPETGREVAEGEAGLIRVFDLANVYSVMAIQTEDLGVRRGDGFELIGRAAAAEPRGCSLMNA